MSLSFMRPTVPKPRCDYCGGATALVTGEVLHPHRTDVAHKTFYHCQPCDAWVGCDPQTGMPVGRLADADLRLAKLRAHSAFDPFWQAEMERRGVRKSKARAAAYDWLARELGMDRDDCHIGKFDVDDCRRVVIACARRKKRERTDGKG